MDSKRGKYNGTSPAQRLASARWREKLEGAGVFRVTLPLSAETIAVLDKVASDHKLTGGVAKIRAQAIDIIICKSGAVESECQ